MRNVGGLHLCLFSCFVLLGCSSQSPIVGNSITLNQSVRDGQSIVSSGGTFELGFFSPTNSDNRYLGIWYKKISVQTVVWVANRDVPIADASGVLKIAGDGNLALLNRSEAVVWSTNASKVENPVAQLLDSGNLVIREDKDDDPKNYLWQSFDHPTNTLLPGMKLGWNLRTGLDRFLNSWKSDSDPSTGKISFKIDHYGYPQAFLWNGKTIQYRSGPWNGLQFSAVPEMKPNNIFNFSFTSNADEVYYSFSLKNDSVVSRLIVSPSGMLQRFTWLADGDSESWNLYWYAPKDQCDDYRMCGAYGICDANASPVCQCPTGFEPRDLQNWNLRDGSGGCVRKTGFECQKGDDGFLMLQNMKVPDTSQVFVNESMSLAECESACKSNCSCTAYANSKVTQGGTGCLYWTGELIDLRVFPDGGQDLYVRVAASDLAKSQASDANSRERKQLTIGLSVTVVGVLALAFIGCFLWKRKTNGGVLSRRTEERVTREQSQDMQFVDLVVSSGREYSDECNKDDLELPLFDFTTIAIATDNFDEANKLGKGGFGTVYKGHLEGEDIAVKRLSKTSGQGIQEFKNEVMLIAKLQHRNLVRLLGCCIDSEEKMLIYEYMKNRSLDSILFDKGKSSSLDWPKRFQIIGGISRGLLYLHQDSRFRIIHRDLKASNILLDGDMNPKISDFGMARIFGGDETEANTKRVVGTYGYMSPEYAMDGIFSVKSDVFSFGVLVLEIVSGKKNRGFYYVNSQLNLLAHAWKLWREGKGLELMDESMKESCSASEVLRCIQVGLLCVQERPEERPTMSSVVLMLSSETATMPQPKHPGFGRSPLGTDESSSKQESGTINHMTVTIIEGR
ncbi:receptor-like serine/threonine-protein kinase SD1-8 isoform X2 [Telopea speciosissima]|uniref:receptor-like serine/threonine-protein kinase SD1-8 isoform X2 n=1 Tax=Telopea speciosissima TaxID=54955 RepID=UPI001CC5EDD7|nr:receptor-like serine/threonine-protein kinase SD1-8 isoform X2 [Telopea speciosissima]